MKSCTADISWDSYCSKYLYKNAMHSLFRIVSVLCHCHPIRFPSWQELVPSNKFIKFCQHVQQQDLQNLASCSHHTLKQKHQRKCKAKNPRYKKKVWRLRKINISCFFCGSSHTLGASFSNWLKMKGWKNPEMCRIISLDTLQWDIEGQ